MLLHYTCPNTYWDRFIEQYRGSTPITKLHFHMVFVVLVTSATLLDVVSASEVPIARWTTLSPTASRDYKLVLVSRNQANRLRQQITKCSRFVQAGHGDTSTGRESLEPPTRLVRALIVRDI
jgi:hypothetical protein